MAAKEAVKYLREQLMLDRYQFATLLGVTNCAIAHWETGVRKQPKMKYISMMVALAKKHKIKLEVNDFITT